MKFKSDKQRKAVMANYSQPSTRTRGVPNSISNIQTRKQADSTLKKLQQRYNEIDSEIIANQGIISPDSQRVKSLKAKRAELSVLISRIKNRRKLMKNKKLDTDGDGVVNSKDCQPFNPKKQGLLHDLQVKRLKAQEQKLEQVRIRTEMKLESQRELLQARKAVSNQKLSIKKAKLKQKQSIIDEIKREKRKIAAMKEANRKAKQELSNMTITGKIKNKSTATIKKTQAYLSNPKTKKKFNKFLTNIQRLAN